MKKIRVFLFTTKQFSLKNCCLKFNKHTKKKKGKNMDIVKKIMRKRARYYYVYVSHTEGIFYGQFFGEIEGGQKYYTEWFDDMQQK